MSTLPRPSRSKRFWTLLVTLSAGDGAAAMAAYALMYGYFRWPDMLDESLPFGGLEFVAVLLLISSVNVLFLGRLYRFKALDAPWDDRRFRAQFPETAVGVGSMLLGGLAAIYLIRSLTDGVSIFDRGAGYLVCLLLTVAIIVLVTAPALAYGEHKLRNSAGGSRDRTPTPSSP